MIERNKDLFVGRSGWRAKEGGGFAFGQAAGADPVVVYRNCNVLIGLVWIGHKGLPVDFKKKTMWRCDILDRYDAASAHAPCMVRLGDRPSGDLYLCGVSAGAEIERMGDMRLHGIRL